MSSVMEDRLKAVDVAVMKLGRLLVLLLFVGALIVSAIWWYFERETQRARMQLIESASSVRQYKLAALNASIQFRTKIDANEHVNYDLSFICNDGFRLGGQSGVVTIEFLDADQFALHKETFSQFTKGCEGGSVCSNLSGRGSFPLRIEQYLRIKDVGIGHSPAMPSCVDPNR